MSQSSSREHGFSTVELLISLFIAAAFIGAGFQLFSVVMEDGNKARLRATASNIANATIQERINTINAPCSPPPATATIPVPTAQLPQANTVVTYLCPYGTTSRTTRINVAVTYGSPQQKVEASLDVTR